MKRTASTFFHARRFVSMETHNVDHFYREAFKKAVPQIGVVTDQMIDQMIKKGGKKAHYVGPLPANVTFQYDLRPLVPAVKTIATSIFKISGDVIVNPPFFFTHLFFRPDKAVFALDVVSPDTAQKNRLDCLYWMLCRYMSLTNRNALETPIRERFDIKRQGNKKKYLCSANEPDELRPFGPEMRYACFRKLSTMYYAHPDMIYNIKGTASTLNALSAASYDRDDQKKPKKPRRPKKAKAAAAAAAAVDNDDDDDTEVPKRKKRKASDKENVDPTVGEEIESDGEDEAPVTKKRKVTTPKVVAPLLDDGGRAMIYDPMFLTAEKLDLAWRKKYDNCRLLPSRDECTKLLQPLASLSLFHQFLTLAQSNSFPESKIWWVLYNGGPSSHHSVKRFLMDACRRWNESVCQMKTAMETAVASCRLDSSNVDHQNMMKTVRKAFHRSNRCWTLETTITQASRDFDNLMLEPSWIFRLLERIRFTVTAVGTGKPIQGTHVMHLVFMLKQSWLGNKPISQCLATHQALSKLVLSNMVQSGVMVDGKLTDIHHGLEIFQHMQDVVIQHIKNPIFMYAAYVTNPPIGPLLEETHTEWVSAATSRVKTGEHKQHSLANSEQQLRNSIHAKLKRPQFMNALQNISAQDVQTPLKAASFLMYVAVLESVSAQKVVAANVLKSIRDKIPAAVNTMFGLAANISAATAATALVPYTAPANALVPVASSSAAAATAATAAMVYHAPPQPERKTYREFLRWTIRARSLTVQSLYTVWERLLDSTDIDSKKPPAEIIAEDMVTFTQTQELQALQVIDTFIRGQFGAPKTGCKDQPSAAVYVLLPPEPIDTRRFAYDISVCFIEKMHLTYKETAVVPVFQIDLFS